MTFKLPGQERKWTQPNNSDLFGTISYTKNMDFDKSGYLSLAKRSRSIFDADLDGDFGRVVAISYHANLGLSDWYFIATDQKYFEMNGSTLEVAEDTRSSVPTPASTGISDIVEWQSQSYTTTSNGIRRRSGVSWDSNVYGSGVGGVLCVFKNKNYLAKSQDNTVLLYDTSHSLNVTLTLPSEYVVTTMDWSNNYMYIGTRHRGNGEAHLFQWDGADTTWNNSFPVGTHRIDSVKAYQDTVALITSDGRLLKFNGGGFSELASLPIYYTDFDWDVGGSGTTRLGRVLHRGMIVENNLIFLNLSGQINHSTNDAITQRHLSSFPSGVWCYDPEVGLYERYTLTGDLRLKTSVVTTGNVNIGTDVITVSGQTVPPTGTPVLYDDGTGGSGVWLDPLEFRSKYYVIYVSDTTMKLAATKALAEAGTALDLTTTGNDLQYFIFLPNRDFGGTVNSINGAILLLKKGTDPGPIASDGRRVIFGGYAGKTTTDLVSVLNVAAEKQENRGYGVTAKVLSSKITDDFCNLTIRYKGIKTAEDKILVKYRTVERADDFDFINSALEQTGTWSDSNTFTTTYDLSDAEVGDEIEIGRGSGAGYLAHITSLSESSGTWTVNIDESLQNMTAADTFLFYISNWELLGSITTSDNDIFTNNNSDTYTGDGGAKTFHAHKKGEWGQFKLEVRGEDVAIYDILINNKPFREFTT